MSECNEAKSNQPRLNTLQRIEHLLQAGTWDLCYPFHLNLHGRYQLMSAGSFQLDFIFMPNIYMLRIKGMRNDETALACLTLVNAVPEELTDT